MLLSFKTKNYKSIRDEIILDLEATGLSDRKEELLPYANSYYLPVTAIYGKNGGGKSNVIRAFWLAVQFILNAQRTQHEDAEVPVSPFELDDFSRNEPTEFEFEYVSADVKYWYGFAATRQEIVKEYLYWAPKKQKAEIFVRDYQKFHFPANKEKKIKEMIKNAVAKNQLYFSISSVMNYRPCILAMQWFRKQVFFSRDYSDVGENIISHSEDKEMLQSIVNIAKIADVGISDMTFEINNTDLANLDDLPESFTMEDRKEIERALAEFRKKISLDIEGGEIFQLNELKATSYHKGIAKNGTSQAYSLGLDDESDGTRKLMSRAAAIEETLRIGGVLVIDEIENRLHPLLVEYIINRFQKQQNHNAQLIFTTHSTDIMRRNLLRRDQFYFVDKGSETGITELYSLADFSIRKEESIDKSYILGKFGAIPYIEEV